MVSITSQPDPRKPGRTAHYVTGPSFEAVELAIAGLTAKAGAARFRFVDAPDGAHHALGETFAMVSA